MRCPDCNKFASLDESQFEVDLEGKYDPEDNAVLVTGTVVQQRPCMECGGILKEYTFDVDTSFDLQPLKKKLTEGDVSVDFDDPEETQSGGGRYAKNMVGFQLSVNVDIDGEATQTFTVEDAVQASAYEEVA